MKYYCNGTLCSTVEVMISSYIISNYIIYSKNVFVLFIHLNYFHEQGLNH